MTAPIIDPQPGAYLNREQAQRAESLRIALELVAGRSVPAQLAWRIAHWITYGIYDENRNPL